MRGRKIGVRDNGPLYIIVSIIELKANGFLPLLQAAVLWPDLS